MKITNKTTKKGKMKAHTENLMPTSEKKFLPTPPPYVKLSPANLTSTSPGANFRGGAT